MSGKASKKRTRSGSTIALPPVIPSQHTPSTTSHAIYLFLTLPKDLFCALAQFTAYVDFLHLMCTRHAWYDGLWHGMERIAQSSALYRHLPAIELCEWRNGNPVEPTSFRASLSSSHLDYATWQRITNKSPIRLAHLCLRPKVTHMSYYAWTASFKKHPSPHLFCHSVLRRCGSTLETLTWNEEWTCETLNAFQYMHRFARFQVLHTLRLYVNYHKPGLLWTVLSWMPSTLRHLDYRYLAGTGIDEPWVLDALKCYEGGDPGPSDHGVTHKTTNGPPNLSQRLANLSWLGLDTSWNDLWSNTASSVPQIPLPMVALVPTVRAKLARLKLNPPMYVTSTIAHLQRMQLALFGLNSIDLNDMDSIGIYHPSLSIFPQLRLLDLQLHLTSEQPLDIMCTVILSMLARRHQAMPCLQDLRLVVDVARYDEYEQPVPSEALIDEGFAPFWASLRGNEKSDCTDCKSDGSSGMGFSPSLRRLVLHLPCVVFTPECHAVRIADLDLYHCTHIVNPEHWPIHCGRLRPNGSSNGSLGSMNSLLETLHGENTRRQMTAMTTAMTVPLRPILGLDLYVDKRSRNWSLPPSDGLKWIEHLVMILHHSSRMEVEGFKQLCDPGHEWLQCLTALKTLRILLYRIGNYPDPRKEELSKLFASHLCLGVRIEVESISFHKEIDNLYFNSFQG